MAEIHLKELAHSYRSAPAEPGHYALRAIDQVWRQGGAYALLGPSGCGKSTLLNIISGLLQPSQGQVLFDGEPVNGVPPQARNIAQVFQFPVVYDTMSVYDNLAFPLRNQRKSEARVKAKVEEVAAVLELEAVLHRKARGLSADEKQKISMGRGLVRDDVAAILFDEPLTVIDPHLKWKLRRKLKQIHRQYNVTMIYVTHDQLEAATFADKIAVMYEGRIVQFGTPRELYENPAHAFVGYFIGSPGMNFFDASLMGNELVAGEIRMALPPAVARRLAPATKLQLGIRPEFVRVVPAAVDGSVGCDVLRTEDHGTYKIQTLSTEGVAFKARLSEDEGGGGDRVFVCFPEEALKLYADDHLVARR